MKRYLFIMILISTIVSCGLLVIRNNPNDPFTDNGAKNYIPKNITASTDKNLLVISWEKVDLAEKYVIYRTDKVDGSFNEIGESATNSYTDNNVSGNVYYYYKVKAKLFSGKITEFTGIVRGRRVEQSTLSSDNNLKSLKITGQTITPNFTVNQLRYNALVYGDTTTIDISVDTNDSNATLKINNQLIPKGKAFSPNLSLGKNSFILDVAAENGNVKTYQLDVTRDCEVKTGWDKAISITATSNDAVNCIAVDGNGNLYIAGNAYENSTSTKYIFIKKFDANGNEDTSWGELDSIKDFTQINSIVIDKANNIYAGGYGSNLIYSDSGSDWLIKKLNSSGKEQWSSKFDGTKIIFNVINSMALDSSDNLYIVGQYGKNQYKDSNNKTINDYDWWIKKLDTNGYEQYTGWDKIIDGKNDTDVANCVVTDSNDNVYVGGYGTNIITGYTTTSKSDWWIKKFDKNGNEDTTNWDKKIDFSGHHDYDGIYSMIIDKQNNLYVAGASVSIAVASQTTSFDWYLRKYNSNGLTSTNWDKKIDFNSGSDIPYSIALDSNQDVYVAGKYFNVNNIWSIKKFYSDENKDGGEDKVVWDKSYSKAKTVGGEPSKIIYDKSGFMYVAGYDYQIVNSYSNYDIIIKKYAVK